VRAVTWVTLDDLHRLEALIDQRAEERRALWGYGGTRRLAAAQVARLAQLTAELAGLYAEKRSLLALLGARLWEDAAADLAGWLYLLARPQVAPPDPQLRHGEATGWRQRPLGLEPAPVPAHLGADGVERRQNAPEQQDASLDDLDVFGGVW
jgi:hypothetical protein